MRVLIIEDDRDKAATVSLALRECGNKYEPVVCSNLASAVQFLERSRFDLIILDLMLPLSEGGTPIDAGAELIQIVESSTNNKNAQLVALTAYEELFWRQGERFTRNGVLLLLYGPGETGWRTTLRSILQRTVSQQRCDFIVVCAVEDELDGYKNVSCSFGISGVENGLDAQEVTIGGYHGRLILLPRMGLVNSAIIGAIAIERFRPVVVAMSGICGGMHGRVQLGQLVVCENSWEYQVGKHTVDGFLSEQYQIEIPEGLRIQLTDLCRRAETNREIYKGIRGKGLKPLTPIMGNFVSGSAVVADAGVRQKIMEQHRKIHAFDMETAALYRAAKLTDPSVVVVTAKTVVDFGDQGKSDDIRIEGCTISARFIAKAITCVMEDMGIYKNEV